MRPKFVRGFIYYLLITTFAVNPVIVNAQSTAADTLHLSIPKAEEIFLQKNLALLANHYNIDISKALLKQAKVWDNPVLNTDQNIYDGKFFRHKIESGQQYGQVYIQVQQLIRTAGKIKKQTQLAQDNVFSAEAQFNDVMRNLKFILSTDLNSLSQLQSIASVYQNELQTMQYLVKGMDEMLKLGDVSQKENVRIKALLFSLKSDIADNLRQQYDLEKEISELLQFSENVWVIADAGESVASKKINDLVLFTLVDSALQLRPDLELAKTQSIFQQHNIIYQKALAKPDFSVGVEYDKLNSYEPNYFGLAVSVPLPLFNKNKGNITAAQLAFKQSSLVVQQVQNRVKNEVTGAWQKLNAATSILNTDYLQLQDNYEKLMKNMTNSYRQRQVSLIEFIDFFDAYKETRMKQWQLIASQRNAAAELNFSVNQNIIKL